jgi:hypothetical protein
MAATLTYRLKQEIVLGLGGVRYCMRWGSRLKSIT